MKNLTPEQWKESCTKFNEELLETVILFFDDASDLNETVLYLESQIDARKKVRDEYFKELEKSRSVEAVVNELFKPETKDQYFDEDTGVARYTGCELDVILWCIKERMDRYDKNLKEVLEERLTKNNTMDEMELQDEDIHFLVVQREVEKRLIQKIQKQEAYELFSEEELK